MRRCWIRLRGFCNGDAINKKTGFIVIPAFDVVEGMFPAEQRKKSNAEHHLPGFRRGYPGLAIQPACQSPTRVSGIAGLKIKQNGERVQQQERLERIAYPIVRWFLVTRNNR